MSPSELLLSRQCGFEPLGQVTGRCVYHIGRNAWRGWQPFTGELNLLTQAYSESRRLAMSRLQEEGRLLGATGILGVCLTQANFISKKKLVKFVAVGTAVREMSVLPLSPNALPFVSGLSGQDHYALRQSGYKPVGFAAGNCNWLQVACRKTQMVFEAGAFGSLARNLEVVDYTKAIYKVRELAITRMQGEANACSASGIVGAKLSFSSEHLTPDYRLILHFSATSTCIARDTHAPTNIEARPTILLND